MNSANNERYYKEIINMYVEAEVDADEAMEMMVQIKGMDSKAYDPEIYKNSKKKFKKLRNFCSRFINKTVLSSVAVIEGLKMMFCMNRVLDGRVTDLVLSTKVVKAMMVEEIVLIALIVIICIAGEVKKLHRMGIRVLSLDLFRLDPGEEMADELVEETSEEEEE